MYGVMLFSFLPALTWLAQETWQHSQLFNAFGVLFAAIFLIAFPTRGKKLPGPLFSLNWGRSAKITQLSAFCVLILYYFFPFGPLLLGALSLTLLSIGFFLFGERNERTLIAFGVTFFLFSLTPLLAPSLDWWLRGVAGAYSMQALSLLGDQSQLSLYRGAEGPMLLLFNEGRPFHVAPECNGFSLLISAILLSLINVLVRKNTVFDKCLIVASAIVLAVISNIARILVIIKLAPYVGEHYDLMHEAVGVFFFYLCLGAVWWLASLPPKEPPQSAAATT